MAVNIAQLFTPHRATPGRILYRHHEGRGWTDVTAGEVAREIARWQAAFRREGLVRGERIALCVRNGVGWVAIDLAALGMGLVVVPLYVDDNADNMAWCVAHAEARLLIVESTRIAASLAQLADREHPLPPVVIVRPDEGERGVTAASFLPPAADADGFVVEELPPDTLATICFTSGTAGRPKGVMLSHGNILANTRQCAETGMAHADDLFLSVLPLSHMFERTGGYYLPLAIGARVAYCRGIAHIAEDLHSQQPTAMFAVPRIFERFHARIEHAVASSAVKRFALEQCVARGYRLATGKASAFDRLLAPALRRVVATPILARLGGRMRLAVVGGAALDPALAHAFIGLGLPMLQGYGMTEASPVIAVNRDDDNVPESVGAPLHGIEVKLAAGGELLARGPNVMLGYWNNPDATRAALTPDGWLRTGDVAEIIDGKIYIRGRAKDILVMSNGEKLPPQDVEFAILRDPVFEQVMLVGEGRPFIVLLAVTRETSEKALIQRANDQLKEFPRWVRVRRVVATREPWNVDNDLLTPTLKLKRPLLLKKLSREIEAAYTEPTP
jgi:long-chain acyl-CoA synthetase